MSKGSKFCIIGIPDHVGVIHVGGRLGSAEGPHAFRHLFSRLQGQMNLKERVSDRGDVPDLGSDIDINHQKATDFVFKNHNTADFSLIIGGSHDHGHTHLAGVLQALRMKNPNVRLGCINIDAHLDVRKPSPKISSGSPFYLSLRIGRF